MTTPTRRRQKDRTALSDKRMTEAAVGLIVEQGLAGTTLASIGERAGYSRGLVTHRFGSKAGLLAHVHDSVAGDWLAHVQSRVGDATGVEALLRVTDALHEFMRDEPDELRAMYLLRYASIDPGAEYRANVARVNRAHIRALSRWIQEGRSAGNVRADVDAGLAAQLFASTVDGLLYRWFVNPALPVDAIHGALRSHLERSLSPPDGGEGD